MSSKHFMKGAIELSRKSVTGGFKLPFDTTVAKD